MSRDWQSYLACNVSGEMENRGLGDKGQCARRNTDRADCRVRANSEGKRQDGIVPPPFGLGTWGDARVVSLRALSSAQAVLDHSAAHGPEAGERPWRSWPIFDPENQSGVDATLKGVVKTAIRGDDSCGQRVGQGQIDAVVC